jgi:hypothetical protein
VVVSKDQLFLTRARSEPWAASKVEEDDESENGVELLYSNCFSRKLLGFLNDQYRC